MICRVRKLAGFYMMETWNVEGFIPIYANLFIFFYFRSVYKSYHCTRAKLLNTTFPIHSKTITCCNDHNGSCYNG